MEICVLFFAFAINNEIQKFNKQTNRSEMWLGQSDHFLTCSNKTRW